MTNDCWNEITVVIENKEIFKKFIENEINPLQAKNEYTEYGFFKIKKQGQMGILFSIWSANIPDYKWLETLIINYPTIWIKNLWEEEGGLAGVWVGRYSKSDKLDIKKLEWDDQCIESKYHNFK